MLWHFTLPVRFLLGYKRFVIRSFILAMMKENAMHDNRMLKRLNDPAFRTPSSSKPRNDYTVLYLELPQNGSNKSAAANVMQYVYGDGEPDKSTASMLGCLCSCTRAWLEYVPVLTSRRSTIDTPSHPTLLKASVPNGKISATFLDNVAQIPDVIVHKELPWSRWRKYSLS